MDFVRFKKAVYDAAADLVGREEELCQLDSFVGDGDHGYSIKKGYSNVLKMADGDSSAGFKVFLSDVALAVSEFAGGAIGPILASFFLGMSGAIDNEKQILSVGDLADMLAGGMEKVQVIGEAAPGDRTLLDTLHPAIESLRQCVDGDMDMQSALEKMAKSAYGGALSTKDMVAKKGRAKNLAERALGNVDAGAMSMYYFLQAFADSASKA